MISFISFIGSNDAGKLIGNDDEGAVLTILADRKFDTIYLVYNSDGKIKDKEITYLQIAEYVKSEIINREFCTPESVIIQQLDFENVADHAVVYPNLLYYLENTFPEEIRQKTTIFAGISSGTPAMQTAWIILAESDTFPLKLIRAVEERHAQKGKRVFDVELLTGTKEKLEKLRLFEKRIGPRSKTDYHEVYDVLHLNESQLNIAASDKPVLIMGETGVGKELLAKTIHDNSNRKSSDFIALNCAALPEQLLESELFGHVKGAFTGAVRDKKGIVEEHKNGTLFLDEINSLPYTIQPKLLRFLDSQEYRKLGSNKIEKSGIRIISASNQNLTKLVAEGRFREDLFYRLRTFELSIPPLRDRKDQIPNLIERLSDRTFTAEAIESLMNHNYRGNVRELMIILERLSVISDTDPINQTKVKRILLEFETTGQYADIYIPVELEGVAYKLIRTMLTNAALQKTKGNTLAASKILGVTHPTIKKWSEE